MEIKQEDLLNTITNVLGLSVKQCEVLSDDGYDTISTIMHWKYDDIRDWCTTKSKLTTTRGGDSYGYQQIKCVQVLECWATNLTLRGKHIFLADFDANMMADSMDEAKLEYEDGKKEPDIEKPDKLSNRKWVVWGEMVYTYFNAMENSQGVPLQYVISKTPAPSGIVMDRGQEIIQNYLLQDNIFYRDTKNVLVILK